jgi:hypothetical protein
MYQNVWGTAKAILRGKFISLKCLHWEMRKVSNNNLSCYLKKWEDWKKKQNKQGKGVIEVRTKPVKPKTAWKTKKTINEGV